MRKAKAIFVIYQFTLVLILLYCAAGSCFSQQTELTQLAKKFDSHSPYRFQEKLFIHLDQNSFLTGETVWLKIYLLDRSSNNLSSLSKVAYLEMTDKNNEVVFKTKIPVANGVGDGSIFLPTTLVSGNYNIIAYTRWMRNFSPNFYFHQTVKIINPFLKLAPHVPKDGPPYDIQFFPEGGNLVAGLKNCVGFRVVGKNGKGIKFKGSLINNKNDTVATFSPYKFGLGQFCFIPESNQRYRAFVIDSARRPVNTPFPDAFEEGYVIHATSDADFVTLDIKSKFSGAKVKHQRVFLFVQSKNVEITAQTIDVSNGTASYRFNKNLMHEGVNKFILFDQNLNPVCERSYFIAPVNNLKMQIQLDKISYKSRGKVNIGILPSKEQAVRSMSVSVYQMDSLAMDLDADISNFLWLTSELRGTVESPDYYLQHRGDHFAIDNLMLTHGWSKFKREDNRVSERVEFIPEYGGQLLSGRVMNFDGTPAKGINAYLSIVGKNGRIYSSQSDEHGTVHFDVQDFYDGRKIVLQTNPKIDSTYRVDLKSSYAENLGDFSLPEFELSKKWAGTIAERSLAMQLQHAFLSQNQTIAAPKPSVPFYGKPDEQYLLDDFTRFPTMEEVMREYVKGVMVRRRKDEFHFLTLDRVNSSLFTQNPLVLLDGVRVFDINKIMAFDPRKIQKLDVITRQYYLGRLTFDGVVSYFTYDGDLGDYVPEKANVFFDEGLQSKREFFSPIYETREQLESRIPDRRHLLLWSPEVKANSQGQFDLSCFTSDVLGNYHIVVQGITDDGRPVVGATNFTVERRDEK